MKSGNGPGSSPGKAGGAGGVIEIPELASATALEDQEAAGGGRRREGPEWVDTPSSWKVISALAGARDRGEIAVIHGGTGVGKTASARRYAGESEDVWIAEMSGAANRVRPCLQAVARACGLQYAWGSAYRMECEIVERMRQGRGLLVIDEAQHLDFPQLEELRALHDKSGRGLALLGNDRFGSRIMCPEFAALASRMSARVHLPRVAAGDVDALLEAWGIEGASAREQALGLAAPPGGIRAVARALRRGDLASRKGVTSRSAARGGAA